MPRDIQTRTNTKTELLDVAQELIQEKGYHAFSFKDVANRVGITTASMHYHFPAKPDLAVALLQRYRQHFQTALADLETNSAGAPGPTGEVGAMGRLDGLVGLFSATHELGRMCLCGTLATDLNTLPEAVHVEVDVFYDCVRDWIADVLALGAKAGDLRPTEVTGTAEAILGLLEGALLSSRVRRTTKPLEAARTWLRDSLAPSTAS